LGPLIHSANVQCRNNKNNNGECFQGPRVVAQFTSTIEIANAINSLANAVLQNPHELEANFAVLNIHALAKRIFGLRALDASIRNAIEISQFAACV
jgi:hypothetical protein